MAYKVPPHIIPGLRLKRGRPLELTPSGNCTAFGGSPYVYDDVTSGSNGAYTAKAGWDAVTGWGSVNGSPGQFFTSFDGKNWAPQQQVPGVGTSSGVSLAVFSNQLYLAWKGEGPDQGIYWSSFNGTSWAAQKQIPGWSSEGPALAVFNNLLYAAWKGMYGDQSLWYSSFNGTSWEPQQQMPGVWSSIGPNIAVFGVALYAVWKGMYGDERIWWTTYSGWAPQQIVPGVGTSTDLVDLATGREALLSNAF